MEHIPEHTEVVASSAVHSSEWKSSCTVEDHADEQVPFEMPVRQIHIYIYKVSLQTKHFSSWSPDKRNNPYSIKSGNIWDH